MEIQYQGYPIEVYYAVAFVGIVLLIIRPRWAFFFIVFSLAARHFKMAVFTRSTLLGEFVNLNDLLLWIGVLAMVRIVWQDQKFWVPNILLAIIGINLLGSLQSFWQEGFHYGVMQQCWGSWVFPILFLVSANIVRNNEDACLFFWALFLGSLGAALHHLFFIQAEMMVGESSFVTGSLRTISFIMSGGIFLVISAFFIDMRKLLQRFYLFLFWLAGISIIAISYVLSFTRTVWVGAIMAVVALFILFFSERERIFSRLCSSVAVMVILILFFKLATVYVLPNMNIEESIDQRVDFIRYDDAFEDAFQTRETGMETELDLWQNSTMIWGVGSAYPLSLMDESQLEGLGALNHVAFSAYLAHFGLIGLITYAFLLPFLTIRVGRRSYLQHSDDFGGVIAIAAMALAFYDVFTIMSSTHYLGPTSQVPGLIYGALWGLSRALGVSPARYSGINMKNLNTQQQWLPSPVK